MRIGIVASPLVSVPPVKYGGTELVIYNLIKGLQEAGHEPILFGTGDSQVDCEVVPIVDKALSFAPSKTALVKLNAQLRQIERRTRRLLRQNAHRLDIIHGHSFDLTTRGFDLTFMKDVPTISTLHNPIMFEDLQYYLKRRNLNYVSISQNQQKACPELNYVASVYNGEDPSRFPLGQKPEDYVCFLGRFDRDKNPHLAIELALSYGIKIKLAGKLDHKGEDYFEQEVKKYFDHPLVEYLGELGFEEKVELLSNAKCNLHPTNFREPFGLTVLEAAYCGTPTLATARGSMSELIEEGRTGVTVEDFVEGYGHLEECFAMDREYIANRARSLFNYHTMTDGYIQAYQKAITAFELESAKPSLGFFRKFLRLNSSAEQPSLKNSSQHAKS